VQVPTCGVSMKKLLGKRTRMRLPVAMPLVVLKTMVAWVFWTPGKGRLMVRLVVVVVPVPVELYGIEYA